MEKELEKLKHSIILCIFVLAIALGVIGHCIEKAADATKDQTHAIECQTLAIESQSIKQAESAEAFRKTVEEGASKIKGAIDALNSAVRGK